MQLIVNGNHTTSSATTLEAICQELGFGDTKVATAVNGEFIPASDRAATTLKEQDQIEIVSPRQGG